MVEKLNQNVSPTQRNMVAEYDDRMFDRLLSLYYGGSDYFNWGYWSPETHTQEQASENLVEKLLDFIPAKDGNILDVACGLGASTRQLLRYYEPAKVVGINLSEKQLERARENAPGCEFRYMDATKLEFDSASFNNIMCVEAAFHFETRAQFYQEAYRVLKPGGWLVTSDILLRWMPHNVPANLVKTPALLKAELSHSGFENVQVRDSTAECFHGFSRNLCQSPGIGRRAGELSFSSYLLTSFGCFIYLTLAHFLVRNYVITAAQKPFDAAN